MNDTVFEGVEGENLIIPLQATGNPTPISYTWSKNGVPLSRNLNYVFDGSTLNFTRLSRSDSGSYSCEALNKEGSSFTNFTVNVQCEYLLMFLFVYIHLKRSPLLRF